MARLNIGSDSFIGLAELNRMMRFIQDDGYIRYLKNNTMSYGIVRNSDFDPNFNSFRIEQESSTSVKIMGDSYAFTGEGKLIHVPSDTSISLQNGTWYIGFKYKENIKEVGTVSISQSGELTGIGTEFTKVMRGQPNHPSVVILDSSINVGRYTIVEVVDDTHALLMGTFTAESDIKYSVSGTFTAGYNPPVSDQFPFRYDSHEIVVSSILLPDTDNYFNAAQVDVNSGTITIHDLRKAFHKLKADYKFESIDVSHNPLIGVYGVKWSDEFSPRDKNIMVIEFGFFSDNYTYNDTQRLVTVNSGHGGIMKDTSYFNDGDFNGWRLYHANGTYSKIIDSTISGGQINLKLDNLTSDNTAYIDEIIIVPDVEEILISIFKGSGNSANPLVGKDISVPIKNGSIEIPLTVPSSTHAYFGFKYRYKNNWEYSQLICPPSDVVGFYDESSFNGDTNGTNPTPDGVLNSLPADRNRVPYLINSYNCDNGFIKLTAHDNSYYNLINKIYKGDIRGVRVLDMSSISSSVVNLKIGESKQTQVLKGTTSLTSSLFINLDKMNAVDGNEFYIYIRSDVSLSGFAFRIVTDYVDQYNFTQLYNITQEQIDKIDSEGGLVLTCKFDENGDWVVVAYNELEAGAAGLWDRFGRVNELSSSSSMGYIQRNEYYNDSNEIRTELKLMISADKNFYKIINKTLLAAYSPSGKDEWHVLAHIEPHSRQKQGDEIIIMLELDDATTEDHQGQLAIVPKGDVRWGSGSSADRDGQATYIPNIRIGADIFSVLQGFSSNEYQRVLAVRGVTDIGAVPYTWNASVTKPKLLKLIWDGVDWIVTSITVLDTLS